MEGNGKYFVLFFDKKTLNIHHPYHYCNSYHMLEGHVNFGTKCGRCSSFSTHSHQFFSSFLMKFTPILAAKDVLHSQFGNEVSKLFQFLPKFSQQVNDW